VGAPRLHARGAGRLGDGARRPERRRQDDILSQARTQLVGPIEEIVASHRLLTGPRTDPATVARVHEVIRESHTDRQTTLLVRANGHVYDSCWELHEVDLEEIVLAYLGHRGALSSPSRTAPREEVRS
jgi:hypothetical protein